MSVSAQRCTLALASAGVAAAAAGFAAGTAVGRARRRLPPQLVDWQVDMVVSAARAETERARSAVECHDLVNAAVALEGAVLMMGRDDLPEDARSNLRELTLRAAARIRELRHGAHRGPERIRLREVVATEAKRLDLGDRLEVRLDERLEAEGWAHEVGEAIHLVLVHLSQAQPVEPMTILGWSEGDTAALRIEQPGHPRLSRDRWGGRRLRRVVDEWSLPAATELVSGQGGSLVVRSEGTRRIVEVRLPQRTEGGPSADVA